MPEIQPLKIPRAIWLNAKKIEIENTNNLMWTEDNLGHAAYRENKIRIQTNVNGYERKPSDIEQTYCHELVHWVLHMMGETELRDNEKFVDRFSLLLHQAIVMAEYGDA